MLIQRIIKYLPEEFFLAVALAAHVWILVYLLRRQRFRQNRSWRRWTVLGAVMSYLFISAAIAVHAPSAAALLPPSQWVYWARGVGLGWGITTVGISAGIAAVSLLDRFVFKERPFHPGRRRFLRIAEGVAVAAPVAAVGYGTLVHRKALRLEEVSMRIPALPEDLDGLRIVQLTDLHVSPFLSPKELAYVVGMANETNAHLAVITGDLTTRAGDPLEDCLLELALLRAGAGVLGCLGNHEIYARSEAYVTARGASLGLRFLRGAAETLRFGAARLNLAGVDYQMMRGPYLVNTQALLAKDPATVNLLLSHNPDVFPVAAAQGWDVTLSGHTHGGQVNVEILDQPLNVARFYTPFVYGLYTQGKSSIYVSRGVGTVGVPVRLGAPPEVSLIRLCAT